MSPEVRSWFGSVVPTISSDPAVQSLATKWLQIKSERDPTLADFWHDADDAFIDHALLFLKCDDDYTYLHHGRYLQGLIGFSMQGRMLSELRTRVRARLTELYDQSTGRFDLVYFQTYADFAHQVVLWGRLCMPLRISEHDDRVALLLYLHAIEDKSSLFKALFERSRAGTIVASPVRDETGRIVDAWIVAQNEGARPITGIVEHATADLLLRHTALFAREDIWDHLIVGAMKGPVSATVPGGAGDPSHALGVELIDDYLVIRLTPLHEDHRVFALG